MGIPLFKRNLARCGKLITLQNRDKVCWYGGMKLIPHLLGLMQLRSIEARVIIHSKIELDSQEKGNYTRRQLSESVYKIISANYPVFKK